MNPIKNLYIACEDQEDLKNDSENIEKKLKTYELCS